MIVPTTPQTFIQNKGVADTIPNSTHLEQHAAAPNQFDRTHSYQRLQQYNYPLRPTYQSLHCSKLQLEKTALTAERLDSVKKSLSTSTCSGKTLLHRYNKPCTVSCCSSWLQHGNDCERHMPISSAMHPVK